MPAQGGHDGGRGHWAELVGSWHWGELVGEWILRLFICGSFFWFFV